MSLSKIKFLSVTFLRFLCEKLLHILTLYFFVCGVSSADNQVTFPARASDLPHGAYWNMSGDHGGSNARDLNVVMSSGNGWTDGAGSENTDRLIFGMPLYSPVNGEVVSCWRNHPENPRPGTPAPQRCCGEDCEAAKFIDDDGEEKIMSCDDSRCPTRQCRIMRSGNHVAIRKADGSVLLLAHLKSGSVPERICPSNAAIFMEDATEEAGDFPEESFLRLCNRGESSNNNDCVAERPRVKRGEFIGVAGNSGASSGPHLHIHTAKVIERANGNLDKDGDLAKTKLNYGWLKHRTDSSTWKPFLTDAIRNPPVLIHASPYLRRSDAIAGAVKNKTSVVFSSSLRAITATIARSNSRIKLIGWDLIGDSRINRKGDTEDVAASSIDMVYAGSKQIVAAIRRTDGRMRMAVFSIGPTGTPRLSWSRDMASASQIRITVTPNPRQKFVTAFRDGDGNLKLIAWKLEFSNGTVSLRRTGDKTAGAISAVSIDRTYGTDRVVTAVRDSQGKLKVIPWELSANGTTISRRSPVSAGSIQTDFDVVSLPSGVAVAAKDSEGKLRVMTWSTNESGGIDRSRRGVVTAGSASEISIFRTPHGGSNLTTLARGADGKAYLIGWTVNKNGRKLRRIGSSRTGGRASGLGASASSFAEGIDRIATTMRDSNNKLKLITWNTNLIK